MARLRARRSIVPLLAAAALGVVHCDATPPGRSRGGREHGSGWRCPCKRGLRRPDRHRIGHQRQLRRRGQPNRSPRQDHGARGPPRARRLHLAEHPAHVRPRHERLVVGRLRFVRVAGPEPERADPGDPRLRRVVGEPDHLRARRRRHGPARSSLELHGLRHGGRAALPVRPRVRDLERAEQRRPVLAPAQEPRDLVDGRLCAARHGQLLVHDLRGAGSLRPPRREDHRGRGRIAPPAAAADCARRHHLPRGAVDPDQERGQRLRQSVHVGGVRGRAEPARHERRGDPPRLRRVPPGLTSRSVVGRERHDQCSARSEDRADERPPSTPRRGSPCG